MLVGPINLVQGGRGSPTGAGLSHPERLLGNREHGPRFRRLRGECGDQQRFDGCTAALRTVNADGTSSQMIWGNPEVFTGELR